MPSDNLPALPALWSAISNVTFSVINFDKPEAGLNIDFRTKPESITIFIPSIVKLVSAIDVAKTILRLPFLFGRIASFCE